MRFHRHVRLVALAWSLPAILVLSTLVVGRATGETKQPSGAHIMSVPATAEGKDALERSDARLIASYESFSLIEAEGADVSKLRRAGATTRDDTLTVELNGRTLDPAADRAPLAGKKRQPGEPGLAVVQFVGPIKDAWLTRLRATGVRVVSYMAQNAYLVHGSGAELKAVGALDGGDSAVRAVVPYRATDKLIGGTAQHGSGPVVVQTVSGQDGEATRDSVARSGTELRQPSTVGSTTTQFVSLDEQDVTDLSADPSVVSIAPYAEPRLRDERAAQIVAGNLLGNAPSGPGYLGWLADKGFSGSLLPFVIDVTDEGLDAGSTTPGHPDFYFSGSTSNASRVVYVNNTTSDSNGRDCGGHGTNVSSIAAGFNNNTTSAVEDAQGYNYGLGIAPAAQIGASKIFRCSSGAFQNNGGLAALASSAYASGARLSSNSWGADSAGAYSADSQAYDAIVRDARSSEAGNQQLVEIFAAGNAGSGGQTVGSPGTAKNVITVGASENVRSGGTDGCNVTDAEANDAHDVVDFSSRGPTADGRLKPDVVAPGTHVTGASPQHAGYSGSGTCDQQFPAGNTLYSRVSGTSQATPEVSGAAALVMDWYRRTEGGGTTLPSPAMVKAMLVNGASDMAGGSTGNSGTLPNAPDNEQGWGRVTLGNVLDGTTRDFRDQTDVLAASGDSSSNTYAVANTGKPVKITVAWTDPPGPTTGNAYVNDLDLVVNAGGRTYRGNQLVNGNSIANGSPDTRNNLENVFLPAGTSGPISVQVVASNVAGDGVPGNGDGTDQDFALEVSNGSPTNAPVLSHQSTSVSDAGGDGDGIVEPGEPLTVNETARNSGNATATGISGTLSSSAPGVSLTQASSAFPDIGSGSNGSNTTPFEADLDGGTTCGAELGMTLDLTTDQSSYSIPISVTTGAAGGAVSRNSSDVPKAIPDGNATGVTSNLVVNESGIIKDVNVRVAQITHTWVGDLKIELIAPDATTIQLANRVGGVNNSANNFTNTVFDDEAASSITSASGPYTGSFRPQGDQLSRLDGKQQQGTWKLRVTDYVAADAGTLSSWGMDVKRAECAAGAPNQDPTAAFTVTPASPLTAQTTTFDSAGSSDPDGTIASRAWDLDNDGQYDDGTNIIASRSFPTAGTYSIKVQVTDDDGATATLAKSVVVQTQAPTAAFTVTPTSPLTAQTTTLDSTGSSDPDGTVVARAWDLDNDGQYDDSTNIIASRSFPTAGTYTVKLRVTDNDGATDVITKSVAVQNRAPTAAFTSSPGSPATLQATTFDSTGSSDPDGTIASRAWDLDNDGQYDDGTGTTASRSFPTAGTYTVKLQVTDNNGATATVVKSVVVQNRLPILSWGAGGQFVTGAMINFNIDGSYDPDGTIVSVDWDFDDDGQFDDATGETTQHSFATAGIHSVSVRLTDNDGATRSSSMDLDIATRPPTAAFTISPTSPTVNEMTTFDSAGSSDVEGTVASVAWDLDNDGQYDDGTGTTASRSFPTSGTYTIGLRVTDNNGASDTVSQTVTVTVTGGPPANTLPQAQFTATPDPATVGQSISFDASASTDSEAAIADYKWDLDGDGSFEVDGGSSPNLSHVYSSAGVYQVGLQVTDSDGATNIQTQQLTVQSALIKPPPEVLPDVDSSAPLMTLMTKTAKAHGKVTLKLKCPATELRCAGTTSLRLWSAKKRAGTGAVLGKGSFALVGGASANVSIKLSAAARRSLARKKSLPVGALLVAKDAAGNQGSAEVRIKLQYKR